MNLLTLGQTGTQETRNLLDKSLGSDESIVLASELLDELLVLVQLLQVIGGHGVDTTVLGTIEIVLVTQDADGHVGARDAGQLDGARETLVTLRVIVLQADLKLDGLEEVTLLGLVGVLQELGDLRPDISCRRYMLATAIFWSSMVCIDKHVEDWISYIFGVTYRL